MISMTKVLADTNIIVYAINNKSTKCHTAQSFVEKHSSKLFFAQQNIMESVRVITHNNFPFAITSIQAIHVVLSVTDFGTILSPNLETIGITAELIKKYQLVGNEVFDAYLVATALTNDIKTIATDNVKHLGKYEEIKIINPF